MDMQSNNLLTYTSVDRCGKLPFMIVLLEGNKRQEIPISQLTSSPKNIHNYIYRVKEMDDLGIKLITSSKSPVQVFWGVVATEEFDQSNYRFILDQKNSNHMMYSNEVNKGEYPWRCGLYHFEIHYQGERYYGGFEVYPRIGDHQQFDQMHQILNEYLDGLATDYLYHTKTYSDFSSIEDTGYWYFINWYSGVETKLNQAISIIERNSQTKIEKVYTLENEPKRIDNKSIIWQNTAKGQAFKNVKYMNRKLTISWDTEANQIVRYRMNQLLKKLDDVISFLTIIYNNAQDSYSKINNEVFNLEKRYERVQTTSRITAKAKKKLSGTLTLKRREKKDMLKQTQRLKKELDRFINSRKFLSQRLNSRFWRKVSLKPPERIVLGNNVGYQIFYQIWVKSDSLLLEEKAKELKIPVYKPTPVLYEYFVYFSVIRCVHSLGFQTAESSIKEQLMSTFFDNGLKDGTTVTLQKSDVKLDIVYDEMIDFNEIAALERGMNFYSGGTHRKPDIRMDYYKMGEQRWNYCSSFIVEVKYRPFHNIYNKYGQTSAMEQMNEYWNIKYVEEVDGEPEYSHKPIDNVVCTFPWAKDQPIKRGTGEGIYLQYYPTPDTDDSGIIGEEELKKIIGEWVG